MNHAAGRLVARLIAIQLVAWGTMELLVVVFAPRLLLLDPGVVDGSTRLLLWGSVATAVLVIAATVLVGHQVRPLLLELTVGASHVEPRDVHVLYDAPWRLVAIDLVGTFLIAASTLVAPLRPETNDLYTQVELALLALTMASVAALPAYVMMRASVATRARARARRGVSRGDRTARNQRAAHGPGATPVARRRGGTGRLRRARGLAARARAPPRVRHVVAPERRGRARPGRARRGRRRRPRAQAGDRDAARAYGFDVDLSRSAELFSAARNDEGQTVLSVPLADGHAIVRFETARLSPGTTVYLGLPLIAIAMAGMLGWRTGGAFVDDVALAERELEAIGVADVLRGGRILGDARFQSVAALMNATDELGGVFREFASAQQRAIDARTSTERMRGLFLASMSHDLKAPLNAILGFAGLVSRGPLTDGQSESVAIIEQRGLELLYLVDTILDAARVEAGELTVSPERTRIGDIVMPAVLDARELTAGMNVEIVGEIQPGVPQALADPARLTQALKAIILVAARFAERGHVVVRASMPASGDQLRIDVDVTGRGIAAADQEKIFDAFKHADRARRHGSLGLGPSLAKSIVELHGGAIDVETTEAGGTVFHVWVPSERGTSRS